MSVAVPSTPAVGPRVIAALAATAAALTLPLGFAAAVAVVALAAALALGTRAARRSTVVIVLLLALSTLVLTPLWLHLLADVPERQAFAVSAALALRLSAVLLVGAALSLALPSRAWLAAAGRFPRLGLALTLTLRQVPDLADEAERVRTAQRARGLAVRGRWRPRALVVPLVARALERADRMGEALLLAGWGTGKRVAAVRPRWTRTDPVWATVGIVLLLYVAFVGFQ